ncbi:MAG: NACHT domain-containing protein, partial [Rhodocyclaceae bacterium]|nr:NACHT domain-containing protein [Rhodocyclaceae bacterium]
MDTRFVRLRLLDLLKSEHALQVHEQAHDYTDLREVLAAIPERAMVLLGAPGSGKTTLLRRLQWDHAADGLAAGHAQVSLFVSLGHYPADPDPLAQAPAPLAWLAELWHKRAPALPGLETLLAGGRVLLLLDALNEMPHRDRDNFAQRVERWRTFLRDDFPPGNMAVFSCRSLDYSEPLSVKDDYAVRQVRVQPLNPGQIEKFLHLHAPEQAARAWSDIRAKPRLVDLYSTPYFLKLLCDQLAYDPRVAGERAALFTGFVRRALEREIAGNNPLFVRDGVLVARDRERINRRAWADAHDLPHKGPLIDRLQALAYAMQERLGASDGKQVVLARDMALDYLDHTQAENILKAAEQLTLLDEDLRTDQVWFYHQLLQEYFAARRLAVQPADVARLAASEWRADVMQPTLADKLAGLQDFEPLPPPDPTGWEETALLACGMTQNPAAFVAGLADTNLVLAARCALELAATGRAGQIA